MKAPEQQTRPIYATNGEWEAVLIEDRFYDLRGEWIGWLDGEEIYRLSIFFPGIRLKSRHTAVGVIILAELVVMSHRGSDTNDFSHR